VRKKMFGKARSRSEDGFFKKPRHRNASLDKMDIEKRRGVIGAEGNAPSPSHAMTQSKEFKFNETKQKSECKP